MGCLIWFARSAGRECHHIHLVAIFVWSRVVNRGSLCKNTTVRKLTRTERIWDKKKVLSVFCIGSGYDRELSSSFFSGWPVGRLVFFLSVKCPVPIDLFPGFRFPMQPVSVFHNRIYIYCRSKTSRHTLCSFSEWRREINKRHSQRSIYTSQNAGDTSRMIVISSSIGQFFL
jgi:hypothetical protein